MAIASQNFRQLRRLNLFVDAKTKDEQDGPLVRDQILSTRIYLILLIVSILILALITVLTDVVVQVKVNKPSLDTYKYLEGKYSATLTCPCGYLTVPYSNFLSMEVVYHQVCSSKLTSQEWIKSLFNKDTTRLTPLDFRLTAATQFRLLALMCSDQARATDDTQNRFQSGEILSSNVMTEESFNARIDALVSAFQAKLDSEFTSNSATRLVMLVIEQSQIQSAVHTNALQFAVPGLNTFYPVVMVSYPLKNNDPENNESEQEYTTCGLINSGTYEAGIYDWAAEPRLYTDLTDPYPPPIFVVTGMRVGCFPYEALLSGTLECFYKSECLNGTSRWISTLPSSAWPEPFDRTKPSRFQPSTLIGSLLGANIIDWVNVTKNFSSYYEYCEPDYCTYSINRRKSWISLLTLLLGLYGSLTMALRTVAPLLVQLGHYIHARFIRKEPLTHNSQDAQEAGFCQKIVGLMANIKQKLLTVNSFEHNLTNQRLGIYATRVYVIVLVLIITILTLYMSITPHTSYITVVNPSVTTFEKLQAQYSNTLSCPCSDVQIPNSDMILVSDPRFHQFCTSVFVQHVWLDGYFRMDFADEVDRRSLWIYDFRKIGWYYFYNVASFCRVTKESVTSGKYVLLQGTYISSQVLSRAIFKSRTEAVINAFKLRLSRDFKLILSMMRTLMAASSVESGKTYQQLLVNDTWIIRRHSPAPSSFDECACSVAFNCPHSMWSGGLITCYHGDNCIIGSVAWKTPGIALACTAIESILTTDYRCFFDQTCIDMLLSVYNYDMPGRLPLPAATLAITAMNSSIPSRFLPNDTMATLVDELFLEEWDIRPNFEGYYKKCAPATCTYKITQQFDIVYIFTTILGLCGGLVIVVRLIIPRCVQLIYLAAVQWRSRNSNVNSTNAVTDQTPVPRLSIQWIHVKQKLKSINWFKKESSVTRMDNLEEAAVTATRLYAVLFTVSICMLVLFNSFYPMVVSVTVLSPTLETFDQLEAAYSSTLSCQCQYISVSYDTFFSMAPTYHQVCASAFVESNWTTSLYGFGSNANSYLQLDRPLLSKQHQIMGWLCKEAKAIIDSYLINVNQRTLISVTALSRSALEWEITYSIEDVAQRLPVNYRRGYELITELMHNSLMSTAFNTDWLLEFGNSFNSYRLRSIPREYANGTCNCVVSKDCHEPLRIGPPELVLPGLVVGCLPIDGLRLSTLECFFSSDCIAKIIDHLDYYTQMNGAPPEDFAPPIVPRLIVAPLNRSVPSRFPPASPIGMLMDELFIEQWTNESNYEGYFNACAPAVCRYEYVRRYDMLYVITSLLGLYSGLTVSLRFIVWNGLRIYKKLQKRNKTSNQVAVQPSVACNSVKTPPNA